MTRVLHNSRPHLQELELVGRSFGKLTALSFAGRDSKPRIYYNFRCICGTEKVIRLDDVRLGLTKSCGCLSKTQETRNKISIANTKHGLGVIRVNGKRPKFYTTYYGIRQRCEYNKAHNYPRYGGRGIKCLWKDFTSFKNDMYESYLAHVAQYGERNTYIERIDNDLSYSKENCRWATAQEQARNKRTTRWIEYNGKKKTEADWVLYSGIKQSTLNGRMRRSGMSPKQAFSTPIRGRKIAFNGEIKTLSQWARGIGVDPATLAKRLDKWPLVRALTTPNQSPQIQLD